MGIEGLPIIEHKVIDWGESCESEGSDRYNRSFFMPGLEFGRIRVVGDLTKDFDC